MNRSLASRLARGTTVAGGVLLTASLHSTPTCAQPRWPTQDGREPLVIAHRGASGYLPEHTLEAYAAAIEQGADFIEPDLVSTRDGHLVARHEPMLGETTDVASRPEFRDRRRTREVDGIAVTDWFTVDFTLAELRTLRAIQPRAGRPKQHDGRYAIPTLPEILDLALRFGRERGRPVGVYAETKHPAWHAALGLAIEPPLLAALGARGLDHRDAPVFIQSFETANLRELRAMTRVRLVQLIGASGLAVDGSARFDGPGGRPWDFVLSGDGRTYADLISPEGLREIARYADGIGPWKRLVIPTRGADRDGDGRADDVNGDGRVDERDRRSAAPTDLVHDAHAAGLFVHPWTFRAEPDTLPADFEGDPVAEIRQFMEAGVDGVFSDFPDLAVKARGTAR
jgi:glycerophosphoryl diester phosphodiesterase